MSTGNDGGYGTVGKVRVIISGLIYLLFYFYNKFSKALS